MWGTILGGFIGFLPQSKWVKPDKPANICESRQEIFDENFDSLKDELMQKKKNSRLFSSVNEIKLHAAHWGDKHKTRFVYHKTAVGGNIAKKIPRQNNFFKRILINPTHIPKSIFIATLTISFLAYQIGTYLYVQPDAERVKRAERNSTRVFFA